MTGSTGNSRDRAGNSGISWDLMGFGGSDGIARNGAGRVDPRGRLSAGVLKGGISRDSRAEFPAISKDFRPAKPSRNSK